MELRNVHPGDLNLICRHRECMFRKAGYRRRGIANLLMKAADAEFKKRELAYAILHSTKMARPLYEDLGWTSSTEMAKPLA